MVKELLNMIMSLITAVIALFSPTPEPTPEESQQLDQVITRLNNDQSQNLTNTIYMAPYDHCSDTYRGMTPYTAICSFSRASTLLESDYDRGNARGDIDIRLVTGKGDYTPQPGQSPSYQMFTFTPAVDSTVRIIPDWYTTDADADSRDESEYPTFSGYLAEEDLINGNENQHGFYLRPDYNRGGTFDISHINVKGFTNGVVIIGRNVAGVDQFDTNNTNDVNATGTIRGSHAPINGLHLHDMNFSDIGNVYAPGWKNGRNGERLTTTSSGNGALRIWNATDAVIESNTFTNVRNNEDSRLGHTIYTYAVDGGIMTGNTFKNSTGTSIHNRASNGWIVIDNTFIGEDSVHYSSWYRHDLYADDNRYAECRGDFHEYSGNEYFDESGREIRPLAAEHFLEQRDICTSEDRAFAPSSFTTPDRDGSVNVSWDTPDNQGSETVRYHVVIGKMVKTSSGKYVEDDNVVASVDAGTDSVEITPGMFARAGISAGDEYYSFVRSENAAGVESARTANRVTAVYRDWAGYDKTIDAIVWDKKRNSTSNASVSLVTGLSSNGLLSSR